MVNEHSAEYLRHYAAYTQCQCTIDRERETERWREMSLVGLIKIYNIEYKLDACSENWQQQCHAWTHIFINNNCWNFIIACNNYVAAGHSTANTARTILGGILVHVDQGKINFRVCENCKRARRGRDAKNCQPFLCRCIVVYGIAS